MGGTAIDVASELPALVIFALVGIVIGVRTDSADSESSGLFVRKTFKSSTRSLAFEERSGLRLASILKQIRSSSKGQILPTAAAVLDRVL